MPRDLSAVLAAVAFLVASCVVQGQPSFRWAVSAGGSATLAAGIAADPFGDIVISGGFAGTLTLGSTNLTSAGGDDIYITKYNRNGTLLWAQRAGGTADPGPGTSGEACYSAATDAEGDIFIAGYFSASANFGPTNLTSAGGNDIYLAKYHRDGQLLWARRAGGGNHDTALRITVDAAGNCYLPGFYRSTANFGATNLTVVSGSPAFSDAYIAKYDAAGDPVWVRSAGGSADDVSYHAAVDAEQNVYVTGYFQNTATFDGTNASSVGNRDLFLAKYDAAGTLLWLRTAGSSGAEIGRSLATDGTNVYVAATIQGTVTFGATTLTNRGGTDVALVKYDAAGQVLWARHAGGSGNDEGNVAIDSLGNLYLSGSFVGTATFGSSNFIASGSSSDLYLAKYDPSGTFLWAIHAGGSNADSGGTIGIGPGQNVYWTGNFVSNAVFGTINLSSTQSADLFVARLNPDPPRLHVLASDGLLTVSWSTHWVADLEQSDALTASTVWSAVTNAVNTTAGQHSVTVPLQPAQRLFRLHVP